MSWSFNPFTGNFDRIGQSLWKKYEFTIGAGLSQIISSDPEPEFRLAEFIMVFTNTVSNRSRTFKMSLLKDDTDLKDQVYSKSGANINVAVNTQISSGNVEVVFQNNELSPVSLSVAKLIL